MDTTDTSSFQIYYRMQGTAPTPSPRDHIIKDGEALCTYGVSVPDEDALKPISEVSKSEWAVHFSKYSNLCDVCKESVEYYDIVPDDLPDPPEYTCPDCGETTDSIHFTFDIASIVHHDKSSFPPSSETHKACRELYDVWRTNPDKPFSYPKLKAFIDDYPQVFRPEEYQQAKIKEQLRNSE